ncbi:MAG: hypothetical protein HY815_18435 [Candidatus Riflebacteria bacterium]|nr:hypothetical protein [Candidatus Riflebacteria bacterium]
MSPSSLDGYSCRVCAHGVPAAVAVACARCSSPHHADCWEFIGGCSVYGCGCRESVPFESVRHGLQVSGLKLAEPELRRHESAVQGKRLLGRLRVGARSLSATLLAGLVGSSISFVLGCILIGGRLTTDAKAIPIIMGIGLVPGLLAPFLAPLQVRHPAKVADAACLALCWAIDVHSKVSGSHQAVIAAMVGSTVLGSALAEWAFGLRSRWAEVLGRAAVPLRYLATGLVSVVSFELAVKTVGAGPGLNGSEAAVLMVLSTLCGGHPLERGKKLLDASFDLPRPLPER